MALFLRRRKATRGIPLVLVGGQARKVDTARELLPDAVFTPWSRVRSAVRRAIAKPPTCPAAPMSVLGGYAGRPLSKKLGIVPGKVVGLLGAPDDFGRTLGDLPAGAVLRPGARGQCGLTLWFVRSDRELRAGIARRAKRLGHGRLWIVWPKKTSAIASDLTQQVVRETGLAAGLVDYKVCRVDETWSGLLFVRRKPSQRRKRSPSARSES